jgi:hypothetical protein
MTVVVLTVVTVIVAIAAGVVGVVDAAAPGRLTAGPGRSRTPSITSLRSPCRPSELP